MHFACPQSLKLSSLHYSSDTLRPLCLNYSALKPMPLDAKKKNQNDSVHFACPQSLILSGLHFSSNTLRPLGLDYSALKPMHLEAPKKNQLFYALHLSSVSYAIKPPL